MGDVARGCQGTLVRCSDGSVGELDKFSGGWTDVNSCRPMDSRPDEATDLHANQRFREPT